ncbi:MULTISPECIES: hypothetical protein [Clostridium]|uniref:hypothetical protein n=1 Tax=Clostridium TaxID=1485 RepID=UPI000824AE03|nr:MULTISPECIES: hypothetical protein [Clostridium]PJI08249.1 hypothetical protein CUB90_10410 [Clostridium sp. CT7]
MKNLLKKEWVYVRWLILINIFLLIISSSQIFASYLSQINFFISSNNKNMKKFALDPHFHIQNYFGEKMTLIIIAVVFFSVFIIMAADYLNGGRERLISMSYTRKQIIESKWIMAAISVVIPLIIDYCFIFGIYFINYSILNSINRYRFMLEWMVLNVLTCIFIITFIMFIQSLHGNNIAGVITSVILLFLWKNGEELLREFLNLYGIKFSYSHEVYMVAYYNNMNNMTLKPIVRILVLITFSMLVFFIMVKIFENIPLENKYNLSMYKPFTYVLRIIFVIVITMMAMTIIFQYPNQSKILLYIVTSIAIAGLSIYGSVRIIK